VKAMNAVAVRGGDQRPASSHVSPIGIRAILRHYLRDMVYGANDGLITTFAVVAGVTGGALADRVVLIIGCANLLADGLSMGVGNYLGIRANEAVRRVALLPEEEASPVKHGAATFAAFGVAGALPLLPYALGIPVAQRFSVTCWMTAIGLFGVGAMRGGLTDEPWWRAGLEMAALGVVVAVAAYGAGAVVHDVLS
jgi:VIT1/CCC1 family predicted Fe2+/Mn2+ transporter